MSGQGGPITFSHKDRKTTNAAAGQQEITDRFDRLSVSGSNSFTNAWPQNHTTYEEGTLFDKISPPKSPTIHRKPWAEDEKSTEEQREGRSPYPVRDVGMANPFVGWQIPDSTGDWEENVTAYSIPESESQNTYIPTFSPLMEGVRKTITDSAMDVQYPSIEHLNQ
jgi:hypothetical protein